jgi:predicted ATPase
MAESTASLISGVDLVDLGLRRLRDLPTLVGVFQVRAPGLHTEFPPLRTLDPTPGNLRPAPTSLIGRESEVAEIEAAVKVHRLVTLTGVGGVGKTRLALAVAAELADEFPDGVWVFELAAVSDPAAVPDAVAAVLGITQQPGKTVSESVAAALEGRIRLLVFDNCEHVVDSVADVVEAILAKSATVTILATSREGLGVSQEQLWRVPSLDVSSGIKSAAVNLFVDRAQSVVSDFSLTQPGDAGDVAEICRRLDGIPLAIELAASRMASMSASEVRDRLDQRFRLLVGSRRGLERHHTLRHAVGWSYDLLNDTEKAVLDRCSVFAGGFDLQSACAVAGSDDLDEFTILDVLDALVRKSLLQADRSSGRTRFSMLETIRQFAEEQLVASGAAADARTAHARHFAGRETDIMALWDSPRQRETYEWFTVEVANLRAAFRWAADQSDLDTAISIAIYAAFFGALVEQLEPFAWAEEMVEPAKAVEHHRLAQLYVLASQCHASGRLADFLVYAEASEAAVESGRFDPIPDFLESTVGSGYLTLGQPERCIDLCRKWIARRPGRHQYARGCLVIGLTLAAASAEAVAASEGFIATAESDARNGNPGLACFTLFAYGLAHRDVHPSAAYEALDKGLAIARDTRNHSVESGLLVGLSRLATAHGDPSDAFDFVIQAIRHYHDSGSFLLMMGPLAVLATLLNRLGRFEPAAIIGHFSDNPFTRAAYPETATRINQLGELFGDDAHQRLANRAESMTNAAMVSYAYEQIDQARAALTAVSE